MDAVKYLETVKKICTATKRCDECPLKDYHCYSWRKIENPEEIVSIVEKWASEHPVKTRQSEFLKIFPNASIENGIIEILPCHLDSTYLERQIHLFACGSYADCKECKKAYWLAEVE